MFQHHRRARFARVRPFLFGALLALALPFSALAASAPTGARAPLILVSIDGYRIDYLARGQSPTLASLAAGGVQAKWMQPAFPSMTFPNHYTLVTGLYPDQHGIINNTMRDPRLGVFSLGLRDAVQDGRWWNEAEPLWVTVRRHGLRSATMFWPGSEAEIHGLRPNAWHVYHGAVTPPERVNQVLAWLDLPRAERPDFITLYFDDLDHAGHRYGPDSPEVDAALRTVDAALGQLVTGLRARDLMAHVNLVIVSDHGMAPVPRGHNVILDDIVDLDRLDIVSMGILAGFNLPGHDPETERALLAPHEHMRCWRRDEIPARFHFGHNPRVPQISCLADTGWRISTREYVGQRGDHLPLGDHGYDNEDPLMRTLFVAHGPAFTPGATLAPFPNVDVYPLLTHLLGVPPRENAGSMTTWQNVLQVP